MDPNSPQIPNLASILQTLKAYAPPRAEFPSEPSDLEDGEYDPSQYDPAQAILADVSQCPLPQQSSTPSTVKHPPTPAREAPKPSASGIVTWPKALNHTVQYIFGNPEKKRRIRYLIETQHAHERQWWASREELIRKAKGRDKSRQELDSVLASVGGLVATSSRLQGEVEGDEMSKELAVFDRKVHRACREMVDSSNRELGELGVPFFCAGISDKLERKELEALRKTMLQLLEDYCSNQDEEG